MMKRHKNIITRFFDWLGMARRSPGGASDRESAFQIRDKYGHHLYHGMFVNQDTLFYRKYEVFARIRESIPMINRAVLLYTRLIGQFEIICDDRKVKQEIELFLRRVRVNDLQQGITHFIRQMTDGYLMNGMSWCEAIPSALNREIVCLRVAPVELLRFIKDETSGHFMFAQLAATGEIRRLPRQEYIYYMAHNLRDGDPFGYSLFESVPFTAQIFMRIFQSIENGFTRVGDPSFFVEFEVKDEDVNEADVKKSLTSLKTALKELFKKRSSGQTGDIVAPVPAGVKASIKTIGADGQFMEMEIPVATIVSQLESATGLPGFLLGVYPRGASGFKISTHQADIITQAVHDIRADLDTVIDAIIEQHLLLKGYVTARWKKQWSSVNLMDEAEQAKAALLLAQAKQQTVTYLLSLFEAGRIDESVLREALKKEGIVSE